MLSVSPAQLDRPGFALLVEPLVDLTGNNFTILCQNRGALGTMNRSVSTKSEDVRPNSKIRNRLRTTITFY